MATKPKATEPAEENEAAPPQKPTTRKILITASNVWADDVKWLQFDVVELPLELADLLLNNKQAKPTRDSATVCRDASGGRPKRVCLDD